MEEVEKKSSVIKKTISYFFVFIVVLMFIIYWFNPFNSVSFGSSGNSNFNLDNTTTGMQFYENMRYPDSKISYKISDCPLKKKNDMELAFEIIANKTVLEFYEVNSDEEISVTCDGNMRLEGGLFIAGEGGPENIINSGNFNVILNGKILLIRDSECINPNVAIHELLHALGFDHSLNPENIMYNISNCRQTIGDEIINFINYIYSVKSLPDIVLENVSALMHGKFVDFNASVKNNGLTSTEEISLKIYADDKFIKDFDIDKLGIGYGTTIVASNIQVLDLRTKKLMFVADYSFSELDKKNNEIELIIGN